MNWKEVGKMVVGLVVGGSVNSVVKNAIKATTPRDLTKMGMISTEIGSWVITSMIAEAATDHVIGQIESFVNLVTVKKEREDGTTGSTSK